MSLSICICVLNTYYTSICLIREWSKSFYYFIYYNKTNDSCIHYIFPVVMSMDVCPFLKSIIWFSLLFLASSAPDRLGFSLDVAITFLPGHMELHLSFRCVTGFLSRIVFLDSTNIAQDYILNYPSICCQLNHEISL